MSSRFDADCASIGRNLAGLIDAAAEEIVGGGAGEHRQNSQKSARERIKLGGIISGLNHNIQLNQWFMNISGTTT